MITKQQTLEFIYELSKQHRIYLDLRYGFIGIDGTEANGNTFSSFGTESTLESAVTQLIKDNLDSDLLLYEDFPIPVDVDMLEVGQTYKVEFLDFTGVPNSFTETLLSITEEDKPVFNFSNGYYTKYIDIKEIYKVNEHANM